MILVTRSSIFIHTPLGIQGDPLSRSEQASSHLDREQNVVLALVAEGSDILFVTRASLYDVQI